jgi:hypothetical protein
MDTNELIRVLASHSKGTATPLSTVWLLAACISIALAALAFFCLLGVRPDISSALETPRFLFKFLVAVTLAVSAFIYVGALSRPGDNRRNALLGLTIVPALIAVAVAAELFALPSDVWTSIMIGQNSRACLTYVTIIGLGPLAVFLWALRYSAPVNPSLAGSVAGLVAGGIAASFYAAHCTDDSPLFVATWYTISIAILAILGAVASCRLARW